MKITNLKASKKAGKVQIFVDGKFAFTIGVNLISDFSLFKGKEVSREIIEKLKKEALVIGYFIRVTDLSIRRPRSKREIVQYLKKKFGRRKQSDDIIDEVVKRLEDKGIADDSKFAVWWVANRKQFRPRGKNLLIQELRQKGIAKEIIDEVIKETTSEQEEFELAIDMAKRKLKYFPPEVTIEDRLKLQAFLSRRGFNYSIASKVVKALFSKAKF